MLLVSRESELKMFAELVSVDAAIDSEENTMSFALDKKFTDNHQIDLVVEDRQRQHAIFATESFNRTINEPENYLIDSVTLMKIVLGADDKISYKQMTIVLPEQQVNA